MFASSQNVQGNHVAIKDCAQVFRLREPRGDRACIWAAEDGTDHALLGLAHDDLVISSSVGVAGYYCIGLNHDHVFVLLRGDESLVFDTYEQKLLETPLGPIFYSPFGRFYWVIGEDVWTATINALMLDFVALDGFDSTKNCALGSCTLEIGQGSHSIRLDPKTRTVEVGPLEPSPIAQPPTMAFKSFWRTVKDRFWN